MFNMQVARSKSKPRAQTQAPQHQQVSKEGRKIYNVEEGLKSVETARMYKWHFETFLKRVAISQTELLQLNKGDLEDLIIEYLDKHLYKQRHLKHATINTAMAAICHFCVINDIWINREKISRFVPPDEDHVEDRMYTRKEIQKLLEDSDKRFKVVILLMANGMRVGGIPDLQLDHLTEISVGSGEHQQKVYKIKVYARSKNNKYYMFVTPECAKAIDDYLEFRKNSGEDITKKTSPLIREQFNLDIPRDAINPRKLSLGSLEKTIERTIKKAGIATTGSVKRTNGFRKFAITMMKKSKVDFSDREYLVGHRISRGLDINYDRTSEDDRLVEWSKAINLLTIDSAFHLKEKLQVLENETDQKIARLEQELDKQRQKMQIFMDTVKPAIDATSQATNWALKGTLGSQSIL